MTARVKAAEAGQNLANNLSGLANKINTADSVMAITISKPTIIPKIGAGRKANINKVLVAMIFLSMDKANGGRKIYG